MPQRDTRVTTTTGVVEGFSDNGVARWRSIPYARPPVGSLRLRAPEPPVPWSGVRRCRDFAFAAPQHKPYTRVGPVKFQPTSEDCLTLNIVSPSTVSDEPLPVMFFVHGGGYMLGSSTLYNGGRLACRGCVFVSVNYRLGVFGGIDLSSLSTPDRPIDGNLALRDLVQALRWVRDNVSEFGGDPQKVTIFGESGGAHAVATLLAVPAARGLFAGVISESPAIGMVSTIDQAAESASTLVARLGARPNEGAAAIMNADTERLVAVAHQLITTRMTEGLGGPGVGATVDGDFLPLDPVEAMRRGDAHPVPMIIGNCADEGRLFTRMLKHLPVTQPRIERMLDKRAAGTRERVYAAYPGYPRSDVCIQLGGDSFFGVFVWQAAEAHAKHAPTYLYRYDYAPRTLQWLRIGATHGTELLAVYDMYRTKFLGTLLTVAGDQRHARRVSDEVRDRWFEFASSGRPGHDWPPYAESWRATMIFDRSTRVEYDPTSSRRSVWADLAAAP
ncbi:carboxylesterase/lipase family protein [Mycobacterium sp.]|uniref:carboxylesterase/lipase family protein n=1 Tax=Mycobacterium sp. TaxID=1785 RepID=UPI003C73C29B